MTILESELKRLANQGDTKKYKITYDFIKKIINSYVPKGFNFEIYLQGSYKNSTNIQRSYKNNINIRGDSDVDIVVQLNWPFYTGKLSRSSLARHDLSNFREYVLNALKCCYRESEIKEGNKSIKLKAKNGRLPADIVVCSQYRKYYKILNYYDYLEGICFWTKNEDRRILNYPKIHYKNGVLKNQNTNNWYKPTVRMFKKIRNCLKDETPSYFLECLIYNVPNSKFGKSYQNSFCEIINWLRLANLNEFMCQNEQDKLFGTSPEQWNEHQARTFISKVISV